MENNEVTAEPSAPTVSPASLVGPKEEFDRTFKAALECEPGDELVLKVFENIPDTGLANSLRFASGNKITAMGDIVDNSIDADADEIRVFLRKIDGVLSVIIADNGCGMTEETLVKALTFGIHISSTKRVRGKFGMGLKIAAGHIGETFEVLTKVEAGELVYGRFDYAAIDRERKWHVKAAPTNLVRHHNLFNDLVCDESGTIIIIKGVHWANLESMRQSFGPPLIKYLGRTFRYWLTPIRHNSKEQLTEGKVQMYVDNYEVFGLDPLERHLASTQIVLDEDVELGPGKTAHITAVYLDKEEAGEGRKDPGNFNFRPNQPTQGIYLVRENREILDGRGGVL